MRARTEPVASIPDLPSIPPKAEPTALPPYRPPMPATTPKPKRKRKRATPKKKVQKKAQKKKVPAVRDPKTCLVPYDVVPYLLMADLRCQCRIVGITPKADKAETIKAVQKWYKAPLDYFHE